MTRGFEAMEHNGRMDALEQEPCGDAISRQAVLDIVNEQERLASERVRDTQASLCNGLRIWDNPAYIRYSAQLSERAQFKTMIQRMSPVTPQPKTGRWIAYEVRLPDRTILNYRCSVCGRKLIGYNTETLREAPFCHCGARMFDPQESKG